MNKAAQYLIAGLIFISCVCQVYAQGSECDQALSHAEAEFNAGHFYSIPSILGKCPESGLSKESRVRAYLLLCQAYLILDNPMAADDSYLRLLQADPEYEANEVRDPIDVVYLSKKFTATPIFTPHFRLGFNTSFFRSIYSVNTEPYPAQTHRTLHFGIQGGAGMDWNINDKISLCGELDFATRGYKREVSGIAGADVQSLVANQNWVDLPIYFKYGHNPGRDAKLRPFGYVGFAFNYLLSATTTLVYTDYKPTASGSQVESTGPNESVTYQRNLLNRSWLVGGGVKYKRGKNFFYVDIRYMGGLSNMATQNKIYYLNPSDNADKNPIGNPNYYLSNNVTKYRYVSDLFRMDNLSLSFGFIHPIYNPRKIKKARTKSVSRKIRSKEGGTVK